MSYCRFSANIANRIRPYWQKSRLRTPVYLKINLYRQCNTNLHFVKSIKTVYPIHLTYRYTICPHQVSVCLYGKFNIRIFEVFVTLICIGRFMGAQEISTFQCKKDGRCQFFFKIRVCGQPSWENSRSAIDLSNNWPNILYRKVGWL